MSTGRACETCDLAPCVRREAYYQSDAAMNGGISGKLHACYYLKKVGFDISEIIGSDNLSYIGGMVKFYKAEIHRCIENGNYEALSNHERSLSDMLVKHKRITEKSDKSEQERTDRHQEVLKELFPTVEIIRK